MPRRREVPKREILPDPVYNSQLVTKFINSLMLQGKKSVAERVFYGALKKVEDRAKDDPIKLFKKAVDNVKPTLEVKSRRVGGSNYQVPVEVRPARRTALAIRWLISYANERGERRCRTSSRARSWMPPTTEATRSRRRKIRTRWRRPTKLSRITGGSRQ